MNVKLQEVLGICGFWEGKKPVHLKFKLPTSTIYLELLSSWLTETGPVVLKIRAGQKIFICPGVSTHYGM